MARFANEGEARRRLEGLKSRHPVIYKDIVQDQYSGVDFKPSDVKGANVLDLGAHIGAFSLLCLSHGASYVTCVEANPKTFIELRANLEGFPARLLNMAVTDGASPTISLIDEDAQSRVSASGGVSVPTTTLEVLYGTVASDGVLKVDIEGSEYVTLLSAPSRAIRSFKTVFLEFHPPPEASPGKSYAFLKEYMEFMGFSETKKSQLFWWTWDQDGKPASCAPIENMVNCRFDRT